MDRLKNLSIFIRTIETGSFTRCAHEMGVSQSMISKAINALEDELKVKLLVRNTRKLSLTEDGKRILKGAQSVVESYESLIESSHQAFTPSGTIRVTCPTALGSIYLVPKLRQFLKLYPEINVQLLVTDSFLDFVGEDIDVALRVGELKVEHVVAKRVGWLPRMVVASKMYLTENGVPKTLSDLKNQNCIVVGNSLTTSWPIENRKGGVPIRGSILVDNHLILRSAVQSGLGIGLGAKFLFEEKGKLQKGLVELFKGEAFQSLPLHVVFRETKNLPMRSRAFIDFIFADLRKQEWISQTP